MPRTRELQFGAKSLKQFLEENLYHSEFQHPEFSIKGWTKKGLTWACNSPETLSLKKVKQLAEFLFGDERKAAMLHDKFGAGKNNITAADLEALKGEVAA